MADPYVGEIRTFSFDFEPQGWLFCNGQQVSVRQYAALYAVIGNTYGGDAKGFNLPDLKGRVPVGMGAAQGLSPWRLGAAGGETLVSLTADQIPSHSHQAYAEQENATTSDPAGMIVASVKAGTPGNPQFYRANAQAQYLVYLDKAAVELSGDRKGHNNMQPCQAVNFCICYDGIFPRRPG